MGKVEFRELAASRQVFFDKGLEIMATCLPRTDLELHLWLEEAIENNDALMFVYTISAAAMSGRRLKASLLPGGACLMRNDDEFAWIAWHSEGEVTEALLEATRRGDEWLWFWVGIHRDFDGRLPASRWRVGLNRMQECKKKGPTPFPR